MHNYVLKYEIYRDKQLIRVSHTYHKDKDREDAVKDYEGFLKSKYKGCTFKIFVDNYLEN